MLPDAGQRVAARQNRDGEREQLRQPHSLLSSLRAAQECCPDVVRKASNACCLSVAFRVGGGSRCACCQLEERCSITQSDMDTCAVQTTNTLTLSLCVCSMLLQVWASHYLPRQVRGLKCCIPALNASAFTASGEWYLNQLRACLFHAWPESGLLTAHDWPAALASLQLPKWVADSHSRRETRDFARIH